MIWAWIEISRLEMGSSARIIPGPVASALAMATRCLWPPENSCGYRRSASALSPTFSRSPAAVFSSSAIFPPATLSGSRTMSFTFIRGLRLE